MKSTQIATLFLDNDLRVTNFTPTIVDIFHLVESDEGRPIAHIKPRVAYDDLADDARRVLRTLAPVEREIDDPQGGAHYIARVLPYRSTDNFIAGVVVTFVDVTARRSAEAALRQSEARYRQLFEKMQEGYALADVVFDTDGNAIDVCFVEANPASEELTGQALVGRRMREIATGLAPEWFAAYGRVARTGAPERLESFVAALGRWYDFNLFKLHPEDADSPRVAVLFQDVTARRTAEDALRQSETRFRALATAGAVSMYRLSADWTVMQQLDDNDILAPLADPVQDWRERYILPEDRARMDVTIAEAIRTRSRFELEHRVELPDGGLGWVRSRAVPLLDENGEVVEWFGAANDITDRKQAELDLRDSEERFRQFSAASPDVLWVRDASTMQWEYLSPAFDNVYGLSRDAALNGDITENWQDLIVPEDRDEALANIARVHQGKRVVFEFRIRRPDGAMRWIRNTDFPMHDATGRVVRIGGIGQDVTELKETEAALGAAERRQRALLEGIPQLVWRAGPDGNWTWASPQWTDFTGLSVDRSLGRGWLTALHDEDRDEAMRFWEAAEEEGRLEMEGRIIHAARQQYRWFQTRATPVRDADGAIVEWLGTSTDIDEMRTLQERQRVLVGELQHRTRNLMIVVRAVADRAGRSSVDLDDFHGRFIDQLGALARVQGLLSRLEAEGRVTFDELIGAELASMGADAKRTVLDGPDGVRLRSSTVQTLALALHELATNAVKHGALGQPQALLSVSWSLKPAEGTDDPPWLHIDWRESGVEMPADDTQPGSGQGRELIERALPYQLDARTSFALGADGVHCTIAIPVSVSMAPAEKAAGQMS